MNLSQILIPPTPPPSRLSSPPATPTVIPQSGAPLPPLTLPPPPPLPNESEVDSASVVPEGPLERAALNIAYTDEFFEQENCDSTASSRLFEQQSRGPAGFAHFNTSMNELGSRYDWGVYAASQTTPTWTAAAFYSGESTDQEDNESIALSDSSGPWDGIECDGASESSDDSSANSTWTAPFYSSSSASGEPPYRSACAVCISEETLTEHPLLESVLNRFPTLPLTHRIIPGTRLHQMSLPAGDGRPGPVSVTLLSNRQGTVIDAVKASYPEDRHAAFQRALASMFEVWDRGLCCEWGGVWVNASVWGQGRGQRFWIDRETRFSTSISSAAA
ncbi:hypothetical protein NMY22_g16088 [Coprinellus aureogranulatus]|nr:hypothetical protein NMY22_g16088 [Coprinellus aureogranulatus]